MCSKMMKAIRVSRFGGPKVLQLCSDVPVPSPGPREILLKVEAISVNPVDTYIRQGSYVIKPELPYTPGKDAAGIVESVGSDVVSFKPSDRVFTMRPVAGCYAEYCLADYSYVFPLHDSLSYAQGACLGGSYFTAYRALFLKAKVKPASVVLVHGASGGVGLATVQLAKKFGCTVIGTAGSNDGMELVKNVGADHVFCHHESSYCESIVSLTKGVDVIMEMLANVNLEKDLEMLKMHGIIAVIGSKASINVTPRLLMNNESSIVGVALRHSSLEELREIGTEIVKGVENKSLKPIVSEVHKLSHAADAHDSMSNGTSSKGKIILIP